MGSISPANSRLFAPLTLGKMQLQNRVAMAPLTRFRATKEHIPTDLMAEYYAQRASTPGTLLISEATFMSLRSVGYNNVPGIYNQAQIEGWKKVTDAVHAKGSYVFCQLWDLGRAADPKVLAESGSRVRSASNIPMEEGAPVPEPMSIEEIKSTVRDYAAAAKNAIAAGFDGVEIHGANGYLIDQFIQDNSNQRTDEYGGSIENRSRFAVEVVEAVTAAVGAEHVGIRLSPYSTFQGMRMKDPIPQFTDVITKIGKYNPVYIHLVEGRIAGNADTPSDNESLDFAYDAFKGVLVVAGGYEPKNAKYVVDEAHPDRDVIVAFGRYFISTPDLVFRLKNGIDFNPYNRDTFYLPENPTGYTDYPFSKEFEASQKA